METLLLKSINHLRRWQSRYIEKRGTAIIVNERIICSPDIADELGEMLVNTYKIKQEELYRIEEQLTTEEYEKNNPLAPIINLLDKLEGLQILKSPLMPTTEVVVIPD